MEGFIIGYNQQYNKNMILALSETGAVPYVQFHWDYDDW